jgi:CO/xanthine dehydrogenase FAD-binding subunit
MGITVKSVTTLAEAVTALTIDRGARFVAGGTLIMRSVNEGDVDISTLIQVDTSAFSSVSVAGSRIQIGATTTLAQIVSNRDLEFLHPAAKAVGGPAIRCMATIGGNLFAPAPFGDLATALLALDATVAIQGGYSGRETPLEEVLALRSRGGFRDIIASISIPRLTAPESFRFLKVTRVKPKGAAILTIAAVIPTAGGRIANARIAYGAMAPTPIRAKAVERALEGCKLDSSGTASALVFAIEGTSPADDSISSAWYRREVLPVHLKRVLLGTGVN